MSATVAEQLERFRERAVDLVSEADLEDSLHEFELRVARSIGAADYQTFMRVLRTLAAAPTTGEEAP